MGNKVNGPGSSPLRTPGKHSFLRKITGRETGVSQQEGIGYAMLDLTAGDGRNDVHSEQSSPSILMGHREWLRMRGCFSTVGLVEKRAETFRALKENFPYADLLLHADARTVTSDMVRSLWEGEEKCAVFLHNDPNMINDFALTQELISDMPQFTTTMSSLGCNVGGAKRMSLEERLKWYKHVRLITEAMRSWHDAMLLSLDRDDAQWAYLVTGPDKWHKRYEEDAWNAFGKVWPKGIRLAWYSDPTAFTAELDRLFLTEEERSS